MSGCWDAGCWDAGCKDARMLQLTLAVRSWPSGHLSNLAFDIAHILRKIKTLSGTLPNQFKSSIFSAQFSSARLLRCWVSVSLQWMHEHRFLAPFLMHEQRRTNICAASVGNGRIASGLDIPRTQDCWVTSSKSCAPSSRLSQLRQCIVCGRAATPREWERYRSYGFLTTSVDWNQWWEEGTIEHSWISAERRRDTFNWD